MWKCVQLKEQNNVHNLSEIILCAPAHELLVVDAEEEADGEEGEEAAVEHLGHEDHHQTVNWGEEERFKLM